MKKDRKVFQAKPGAAKYMLDGLSKVESSAFTRERLVCESFRCTFSRDTRGMRAHASKFVHPYTPQPRLQTQRISIFRRGDPRRTGHLTRVVHTLGGEVS